MPIFKCAGTQRFDDGGQPLCDHQDTVRWLGRCPGCGRLWNVIKYDVDAARRARTTTLANAEEVKPIPRVATGVEYFDEVTNGGLPEGSVVIISGPAGTGKTTLNLILADGAATHHRRKRALYASAEETNAQLLEKAHRCGLRNPNVELMGDEANIYNITARAEQTRPALLIIDSLQEMYLDGGDNMAVLHHLKHFCTKEKVACLVVSHVTRGTGEVRGPTAIDHYVDAMLEFDPKPKLRKDGEEDPATEGWRRLKLAMKTRIGPSGSRYFNMTREGLIVPLDEDTFFGRKKKRASDDDGPPPDRPRRPNLVLLADKYRKKDED